MLPTELLQDDY